MHYYLSNHDYNIDKILKKESKKSIYKAKELNNRTPSTPNNGNGVQTGTPSTPNNGNGVQTGTPSTPNNGNGVQTGTPSTPNNGNGAQTGTPSTPNNGSYIREKDLELMRNLYSTINKAIYPFVVQALNEFEFIGSPIYSILGLDRETINQIVDRVIDLSEEQLDEIGEILNGRTATYTREWQNWDLLRAVIESLVLHEIFGLRRVNYFKKYAPELFN